MLHNHPPHPFAHLSFLDWHIAFRYRRKHSPICVDARRVDQQYDQTSEQVDATDDKKLLKFFRFDRLIYRIRRRDGEEEEQDYEKGRVRGRVPDAEEWNAHHGGGSSSKA